MDPRSNNTSSLGLPQPGNDMGQLPPIHTPQSFHAPDTATTRFETAAPDIGTNAPVTRPAPLAQPDEPLVAAPPVAAQPASAQLDLVAQAAAQAQAQASGPADDADTAFDEEWVNRAREVILRTQADPFLQSQELGKLKAQYIKLRYNKDIKVSE